jgi:hypothetical protein
MSGIVRTSITAANKKVCRHVFRVGDTGVEFAHDAGKPRGNSLTTASPINLVSHHRPNHFRIPDDPPKTVIIRSPRCAARDVGLAQPDVSSHRISGLR